MSVGYLRITHYLMSTLGLIDGRSPESGSLHLDLPNLTLGVLPFVHAALTPFQMRAGEVELLIDALVNAIFRNR